MTYHFLDVTPNQALYDDIYEATNLILEDGEPLMKGLLYQQYAKGKPFLYEEFKGTGSQKTFTLTKAYKESSDNPLIVYVDGVQTIYKSVTVVEAGTKIDPPYPGYVLKNPRMNDTNVGKVQSALKAIGYYGGAIDNDYGPATANSVKAYQKLKKLVADGIVGTATWSALFKKTVRGGTHLVMYTAPPKGSTVAIMALGVPYIDPTTKRPTTKYDAWYPFYKLKYYSGYVYRPDRVKEYLTIGGRRLKRLDFVDDPKFTAQALCRRYMKDRNDVYLVRNGRVHVPWIYEGMSGTFSYGFTRNGGQWDSTNEVIKPITGTDGDPTTEPYRNDRFFPDAPALRHEVITAMNRLRIHFYDRFTDTNAPSWLSRDVQIAAYAQTEFELPFAFPHGKGELVVTEHQVKGVNNGSTAKVLVKEVDYKEISSYAIRMLRPVKEGHYYGFTYRKTKAFFVDDVGKDVQYYDADNKKLVTVKGMDEPWVYDYLALESEKFHDNTERMVYGRNINRWYDAKGKSIPVVNQYYRNLPGSDPVVKQFFMPYTPLLRSEGIVLINRLRRWCLERFK